MHRVDRIAVVVDENGPTFAANAQRKALAGSRAAPEAVVLASDGGLEIPALGKKWDPLFTSRFAVSESGLGKAAALVRLLDANVETAPRARWVESLAVVRDGLVLGSWTALGPYGVLRASPPARDPGRFWVDALLGDFEPGIDHWNQLANSFRDFCLGEGLK